MTLEPSEVPPVLTTDEVAELLRVSSKTVLRLHIPFAKFGRQRRYLREDVLNFLREKVA